MQPSKARFLVFASIVFLAFSGTSKAEEHVGSFRVDLTGSHAYAWEKYQEDFSSTRFAIRLSDSNPEQITRSTWYNCRGSACSERNRSEFLYHLKMNQGGSWRILAENKKVIWKGPVCYKGQNLSKFGDCNNYSANSQTSSSSSSNQPISDKTLCGNATDIDGGWEKKQYFKSYVDRAKARNLTLAKCAELTGRPNKSSGLSDKQQRNLNDKAICSSATTAAGDWDLKIQYKKYLDEAKRRNLTLKDCSALTGRSAPTATITATSSSQSSMSSQKDKLDTVEVRLKKLKKLEDAGLITGEEAAEKRKEILRDM